MAEVKWIKIVTDIFGNRKIKQIESMPEADTILVIWFKLLCLSGNINECGLITITKDIPYTDEMLSTEFRRPLPVIRLALSTFEKFGMIEIVDNILCVSNWERYQNVDGMERAREISRKSSSKYRERRKLLISDVTVTSRDGTDIDRDIDIEEDIKKESTGVKGDSRPRFSPPSIDDVRSYCQERGNGIDPERFIDFYAAKNWMVGKNKMTDWKACVRTWERRDSNGRNGQAAGDSEKASSKWDIHSELDGL